MKRNWIIGLIALGVSGIANAAITDLVGLIQSRKSGDIELLSPITYGHAIDIKMRLSDKPNDYLNLKLKITGALDEALFSNSAPEIVHIRGIRISEFNLFSMEAILETLVADVIMDRADPKTGKVSRGLVPNKAFKVRYYK